MKRKIKSRVILVILCLSIFSNILNAIIIINYSYFPPVKITGGNVGVLSLIVEDWRRVNIASLENKTYNFDVVGSYPFELNVTANFDVIEWNFTHIDLTRGIILNNSYLFTPNISLKAVRRSNEVIVYASDINHYIHNYSVTFYVNVPNSAPLIESIDPQIFVCEKSYLFYYFNASDVDEDVPIASIYPTSPTSPFYVAYSGNINKTLNKYEIFSGVLSKSRAGGVNAGSRAYLENVSVNDGQYYDYKTTNITVIEVNNAPDIEPIGVQMIWSIGDNATFYHAIQVNDNEDGNQDSGNLTFNLTIKNSSGNFFNLFNVSNLGVINFSANTSNLGSYIVNISVKDNGLLNPHQNISLCGQDGKNLTSYMAFSLTVTNSNRLPIITSHYPNYTNLSVNEGDTAYFNISMRDPDMNILDTYWYIDRILQEYDSGVEQGGSSAWFYHTFGYDDAGIHNLTVKVTDSILNSSYDFFIWRIAVNDSASVTSPSVSGGGGGGGGAPLKKSCIEKWGCNFWSECRNLKNSYADGTSNYEAFIFLRGECAILEWKDNACGFQTRECVDINNCTTKLTKPEIIQKCKFTGKAGCADGIKNCHSGGCEDLADCGGPCPACPTCSDGIQNQGERGIDCGGPCRICPVEMPLPAASRIIIYSFVVLFLICLIFIIIMIIRYYKVQKEMKENLLKA